jgi:hypothetical protein
MREVRAMVWRIDRGIEDIQIKNFSLIISVKIFNPGVHFSGERKTIPMKPMQGTRPDPSRVTSSHNRDNSSQNKNRTGLKGFEPLTYGLRVRRSTELSYKPAN